MRQADEEAADMRLPGDAGIRGPNGCDEGEDVVRGEPDPEENQNLPVADHVPQGLPRPLVRLCQAPFPSQAAGANMNHEAAAIMPETAPDAPIIGRTCKGFMQA